MTTTRVEELVVLTDEELQELARKHKTSFENARWLAVQFRGWQRTAAKVTEEVFSGEIRHERLVGHHHDAGIAVFVYGVRKQNLSVYDATDLLIALVHGQR